MTPVQFVWLCGLHSAAFAGFHLLFWRLFRWRTELPKLTRVNRGILQILNLRLIYVFGLFAFLCFAFPVALAGTPLGRALLSGMALFWAGRLVEQFVFLRLRHPLAHVLTALFALGIWLCLRPLW